MISRVTYQQLVRSAQGNLQANMAELARLQTKASSQSAIARPSDDPGATAASLRIRADLRAVEQYSRNIDDGAGWLTIVDSALATTTTLMNRVRDLTVRGANDGVLSPAAKKAIATELEGIKSDLLNQANTSYLGRTVFAGTSDAGFAFDADSVPPYAYTGAPGSSVERRVSATATVRVDADGAAVFGVDDPVAGTQSVFALIDGIIDDLTSPAPANVGARLADIDARMDAIREQQAVIGTRHAAIKRAEEITMDQSGELEAQRSAIEDVDLARTILDLRTQEVAYQSALAVTARTLQPTLMDFLR